MLGARAEATLRPEASQTDSEPSPWRGGWAALQAATSFTVFTRLGLQLYGLKLYPVDKIPFSHFVTNATFTPRSSSSTHDNPKKEAFLASEVGGRRRNE
jgi:hypothetical protein